MSQGVAAGNLTPFGQLKYPSEIYPAEDNFFPEAIRFGFYQRTGVDFDEVVNVFENTTGDQLKIDSKDNMGTNNQQDTDPQKAVATLKQVALQKAKDENENLDEESWLEWWNNTWAKTSKAMGSLRRQNSTTHEIGSIYLHMPNNISLNEEAGWGGESLGVVGNMSKNAFKTGDTGSLQTAIGGTVGSAGNILAAAAGGIVGKLLSKIPGINAMGGGLLGMIGGEVIQKGGQAAFSVASNPYMEMMFSGIGFRSFKFDFIFRARNKKEIKEVGDIIKMFRQHSRPTWVGGTTLGKSFMNYPQEFHIQFLTDTSGSYAPNLHLPYLKPAVCTAVETNFTPDNIWSAYKDGAPVAITLGLTFSEMELVMAEDVARDGLTMSEQEGMNPVGGLSDRSVPDALGRTSGNGAGRNWT
jgi:hypothetical protein